MLVTGSNLHNCSNDCTEYTLKPISTTVAVYYRATTTTPATLCQIQHYNDEEPAILFILIGCDGCTVAYH